ncbi:sporulation inhibitor of replication protein SirA [Fictibacillus gelatini]|uniref:sporulation inhibitor of replication protein SirA n=1 Tax=Fictibacillus gelatini TaxID=225985 RepID=UPI00040E0418|nr:sporulation inhibitor of replication protein SirA [Fictibacillus gelatini]
MREYYIYKINEEVASEFFSKEGKLFHLFLEEYKTFSTKKEILLKQIHYITSSISCDSLEAFLIMMLKSTEGFTFENHSFLLECEKSSARLHLSKHYLVLQSAGNYEAETIFFEMLRKYERCFFAMEFDYYRYGWLNPLRVTSVYGS